MWKLLEWKSCIHAEGKWIYDVIDGKINESEERFDFRTQKLQNKIEWQPIEDPLILKCLIADDPVSVELFTDYAKNRIDYLKAAAQKVEKDIEKKFGVKVSVADDGLNLAYRWSDCIKKEVSEKFFGADPLVYGLKNWEEYHSHRHLIQYLKAAIGNGVRRI